MSLTTMLLQNRRRKTMFRKSADLRVVAKDFIDHAKTVRGLRYGLVNVRTDGESLVFAQIEESGKGWAYTSLSADQIAAAR